MYSWEMTNGGGVPVCAVVVEWDKSKAACAGAGFFFIGESSAGKPI